MENSTTQSKWYDKTWLVIILCIIFFPAGLYGIWKNQSISKGWKIGVTVVIALIVFAQLGKEDKGGSSQADNLSSSSNEQTEQKTEESKSVRVGEVLHTDYFDITVNKVSLEDRVNTGNEFADLKAEQGNMYLIINATFKNTDQESRMLMDGSVWINYNGKDYEFDKSETVILEGWGLLLDQINPLTTKTTKLVYKIPAEIKGTAYWQPGRADKDQKILLGGL
jgi:hypothetical protein